MRKYLTELIGTFFLVLTVGCTAIKPMPGVIPPLAIGSILMVMIFAGGHISGAHYNPAVTLGVWIRGRCSLRDALFYVVAQLGGALLAVSAVSFLRGVETRTPVAPAWAPAFLAEFLFTFALVYVVLNAATARETEGNSFYGLAIGMTVLAGAFAVGNISGAAFNPAVAIGVIGLGILPPGTFFFLYLPAELLGGVIAGIVFRYLHPED
ncbi:MIP/aquaporin family protein [Candidatus Methylacidithermus pantelleriae]|nr:aquaporin [Candidatus Methylacidithermus pantelleriae]